MRKVTGGVLLIVLGFAARATAREQLPPIAYDAPAGCPDAAAFGAIVRARLGERRGEPLLGLEVKIVARDGAFQGDLRVREREGPPTDRVLSGATCAEVANALAFVTVLAMGLEPLPAAPPPPSNSTPPPPPPPSSPSRPPTPPSLRISMGIDALAVGAVGPTVRPGVAPFLGIAREGGLFSPAARVGFTYVSSGTFGVADGSASLSRTTATLDVCPVRLALAAPVAVRPCAGVDGGVLHGSGGGAAIVNNSSESRLWLALLLGARLEWTFAAPLHLEGGGGLTVPLVRDRFYFGPNSTVYEVPVVAGALFGGLAATLP